MPRQWRYGLLGLSATTIGLSLAGIHDQHRSAACLARYEEAFAAQSSARSALATQQNDAVNDVLLGAGRALAAPEPKTPAEVKKNGEAFRALFTTYKQRTDAIAAQRRDHPLPMSPKGCHR